MKKFEPEDVRLFMCLCLCLLSNMLYLFYWVSIEVSFVNVISWGCIVILQC